MSPLKQFTGVVLAGGKSARFGSPKARVIFDGKPMLRHAVDAFQRLFQDVIVVEGADSGADVPGATVIRDEFPGCGPLGGIHAGLKAAATPYVFVTACDQPFVNADLVRAMAERAAACDALVPRTYPLLYPLFACYSKRCLPVAERCLAGGVFQVRRIYEFARTEYADREWLERHDPDLRSLFNVNTPADYDAALRIGDKARECVA